VKLERFETNIVDLAGPQGLLGQASGRRKDNVIAWLDERGQDWKDQIQIVAMDPCATYRAAVRQALPNALIVADHFHLVSLANKTVTEVRRRVTVDTTGHRGTAKDPIWAKRTRLLRAKEHLSPEAFSKMWNGLIDTRPGRSCPRGSPRKSSASSSPWPRPAAPGTTSPISCSDSTAGAPTPPCPSSNGSPAPSKRGGLRSWASWKPVSPTPRHRPRTGP